jgi:hypothetical protein
LFDNQIEKAFTMNILGIINRLAAASALVAITSSLVAASHSQPEISAVNGSVSLNDQRARVGDLVGPGSVVKTGANSFADVFLGVNGPTVQVMENTAVTIEELAADESGVDPVVDTKLNLTQGKISGYVRKTSPNSTYTVTTPTATAAVRGTVYMISADGYVWVWEGCVDVAHQPPGGGVTNYQVCAGQMFDPFLMTVVRNELNTPYLDNPALRLPGGPPRDVLIPTRVTPVPISVGPDRVASPVRPHSATGAQPQPDLDNGGSE